MKNVIPFWLGHLFFFSLWLWFSFIICCFDVLLAKCVSFAGYLLFVSNISFNKLYKSTNQIFFSLTKTQNRKQNRMTRSDNIVYALCNFFVKHGMGYVSCASKTNIVRRWLNYVCLCWLSQIHRPTDRVCACVKT